MLSAIKSGTCVIAFLVTALPAKPFGDDAVRKTPTPTAVERGHMAIKSGVAFLQKDAVEWRRQKTCATCHHGVMTVWAMSEAKAHGYTVPAEGLKEVSAWTLEQRFKDLEKPRDARPGFNMVNTPALYLGAMMQTLPKQDVVPASELQRIAGHLVKHQESDGAWKWTLAPPANRFPPAFESDEVATILGLIALNDRSGASDPKGAEQAEARRKAEAWLAKTAPTSTTQALAYRLVLGSRGTKSPNSADIERLVGLQQKDGGWSQLPGLGSDAYATGQVLFALNLAGVSRDRPEIQRGVAYLASAQRADGSWPMIPRAQPGEKPAKLASPIVHFGSAWATIGLVRSVSPIAAVPSAK